MRLTECSSKSLRDFDEREFSSNAERQQFGVSFQIVENKQSQVLKVV